MDKNFTILRREQLLINHALQSTPFRDPAGSLLSAAVEVPALPLLEIRIYSPAASHYEASKQTGNTQRLDQLTAGPAS